MYQVVVYMAEDVPFNCRVCCPGHPGPWETVVKQEMYNGMKGILDSLLASHSSMLLVPLPQNAVSLFTFQDSPFSPSPCIHSFLSSTNCFAAFTAVIFVTQKSLKSQT